MKHLALLLGLLYLSCDCGDQIEPPSPNYASSYYCSAEQAKEVRELTKSCQGGAKDESLLDRCFERSIFVTCTLKEPKVVRRCLKEPD